MLIDKLFPSREPLSTPGPADDYWYGRGAMPVSSGVRVNEDTALNYSAVWAATRVISETVASLPLLLYRRQGGSGKSRATSHPLYSLLHDEPNPEMSSMTFRDTMTAYIVNWGNGIAEIERTRGGRPIALWPIHPSRVRLWRDRNGQLWYLVSTPNAQPDKLLPEDVLHVPGVHSQDGLIGRGVIAHARESIGMGIATEQYGAAFFGNGATPGGVLEHPKALSETAATNLRKSWNSVHQGSQNAGKVAILEEGMKYSAIGLAPEDAQFLETRKHNITEFARWYRVPPHMLADLERATFSNIEAQGIEFLNYSLMPWLERWENELCRKLLTQKEKLDYSIEHLVDGLLRGDAASRAESLQKQFDRGAVNIDEWRAIENRNPLPDGLGKLHFVPLNMTTVERAAEGPPEPKPPEPPVEPTKPPEDKEPSQKDDQKSDDGLAAVKLLAETLSSELRSEIGRTADVAIAAMRQAEQPLAKTEAALSDLLESERKKHTTLADRVLASSMRRVIRKEVNEAQRAAKKPAEFIQWMESFYGGLTVTLAAAIEPELQLRLALHGDARDSRDVAAEIAHQHIARSRELLLTASECQPAQLAEKVTECVSAWNDRAVLKLEGESNVEAQDAA